MKLELAVFLLGYLVCTATATDEHEHEHGGDEGHDGTDHTDHRMINVTTIIYPPYVMEKDGHFEGLAIDLLEELAHRVHFNYRIHEVKDGKWGSRDSMGNWDGMIGELLSGEADLLAAPLAKNRRRENSGIFFVRTFMEDVLTILVKDDVAIETLKDLLKTNMTIGCIEGGTTRERITSDPAEDYIMLNSRIGSTPGSMVATPEEGVARARKGDYAFIMDKASAMYYATHMPCNLKQVDKFLPGDGEAFAACPHHKDLADELSGAIQDMEEDKKLQELMDKWFPTTCGCTAVIFHIPSLMLAVVVGYLLRQ